MNILFVVLCNIVQTGNNVIYDQHTLTYCPTPHHPSPLKIPLRKQFMHKVKNGPKCLFAGNTGANVNLCTMCIELCHVGQSEEGKKLGVSIYLDIKVTQW